MNLQAEAHQAAQKKHHQDRLHQDRLHQDHLLTTEAEGNNIRVNKYLKYQMSDKY